MTTRARHGVDDWIDPLARFGFAARGLVYVLVGALAAGTALGVGGRITDPQGAMGTLGRQPFGTLLLVLVGLGLLAYAVWRFAEGVLDLEGKGKDVKGLVARAGFVGSGLVHLGLALSAASLAIGLGRGGSDPVREWAGRIMAASHGRWVVAAAGFAVVAGGLYQFYKAWAHKFEEDLRTGRMSAKEKRWARRVGRAGLCARGVTFCVIGWFLVRAALEYDPGEARGMEGALRTVARQAHGKWLLGAVAVGLTAYGLLSLVEARYRRII